MSDSEAESLALELLRRIDSKVDALASRAVVADEKLALVTQELAASEKRLSDQIGGLRRAVVEYHASAIGHGVFLHELDERIRRLEEHFGVPPAGTR